MQKPTIGPPGIEPGLHAPHACVLPVYYGPFFNNLLTLPWNGELLKLRQEFFIV